FGSMTPAPRLLFQAYDILVRKSETLLDQPLWRRRELLRDILRFPSGGTEGVPPQATEGGGPAFVSDWVECDGKACFEAVAARRLPGMIAKQKQSVYLPGRRSEAWQELRVYESGWFVVGGY